MKRWHIVGVGLFTLLLACTTLSHRQRADALMAQGDYESALRVYVQELQPRKVNGKRVIDYSPDVVTRIGISALNMNITATAVKVFRFVNRRSPDYGMAYLYLGITYEQMGDYQKAKEVYGKYTLLSPTDKSYDLMKGRGYVLREKQIATQARQLINSSRKHGQSASKSQIAVLDLKYDGFYQQGSAVSKALSALVIEDLRKVNGLQVIDRALLLKVLEILNWSSQDLNNQNNIRELMKVLNVGSLVTGTLKIETGDLIEVEQIHFVGSEVQGPQSETFSSTLQDFARLQKKMVFKVLKDVGISLNPALSKQIREPATLNHNAFVHFGHGLDAWDHGAYSQAQNYFDKSLQSDASFELAQSHHISVDAMDIMQMSDIHELEMALADFLGIGSSIGGGRRYAASTSINSVRRLQEMGVYLDAGFIPGPDSRKALEEIGNLDDFLPDDIPDVIEPTDLRLPPPPDLPELPNLPGPVEVWFLPDPPATPHR